MPRIGGTFSSPAAPPAHGPWARVAVSSCYRGNVRGVQMPVTERTPQRLVIKSGSTTLTLDKDAGKAILQRMLLLWKLKPAEASVSDITDVTIDTAVDRASGVEMCSTMLVLRSGAGWALPASDKKEAQAIAGEIRGFVGLPDKN